MDRVDEYAEEVDLYGDHSVEEKVEETVYQEGSLIMPFYIICDASGSMSGEMARLQASLERLVQVIAADNIAADAVMVSIITFGSTAKTVVPLSSPEDITVPHLGTMGGTSFATAFKEFADAFAADRERIKKQGSKVFRPCIFFLTDGQATDSGSWERTFQDRIAYHPDTGTGNRAYPYIVAYGFRDASEVQLKKIAYPNFGEPRKMGRWFLSKDHDVSKLLESMIGTIGKTIVSSGHSVHDQPEYALPPVHSTATTKAGLPDILD